MKKYNFCTMIGNPSFYGKEYQDYSEENINRVKNMGADMVLINIAFSRPYIDPVNLEDIAVSVSYPLMSDLGQVKQYRVTINEKICNAKKAGLKTIGLFGIPKYLKYDNLPDKYLALRGATTSMVSEDQVTCVKSEETMKYYKELIEDLLTHYPELDGMLVYTFDELAEVCAEESDCPRCRGISLEERIIEFLNELNRYCKSIKPAFEMWWEPWELSASQVYGILQELDVTIALSCHSTLYEVYFINHPDIFVRNAGAICKRQGRKFVVELFLSGSGEELGAIAGYPCPRLIYEQVKSLELVDGVGTIKEYYGCALQCAGINEKVLKKVLMTVDDYQTILESLMEDYGDTSDFEYLKIMWEYSAQALMMAPWDISWILRMTNYHPYDKSYWGKVNFFDLMKTPWTTPSWLSSRRSYYIVVDSTHNMNMEMQKDTLKRLELAIYYLDKAMEAGNRLKVRNDETALQLEAILLLKSYFVCRRNHLDLTMQNNMLRNGEDNIEKIAVILNNELENAGQFLTIVENSRLPYILINTQTIREGMEVIKACIKSLEDREYYIQNFSDF